MAKERLRGTVTSMGAVVVLILLLAFPITARAATGYVITQREGASRSRLTLASGGLRFDALAPTRRRGKAKPQLGMIVRYRDAHLFLLDPPRRVFQSLSLATAVASYRAEAATARKGQPSERLPAKPGTKQSTGQARLVAPRAKLTRLRLSTRIGPVRAHAYLLRQGATRERIWYAAALPRPPARVRALFGRALGGAAAGPFGRAIGGQVGRIPLRIDTRVGRRWRTTLKSRIVRRKVGTRALRPPPGYRERALLPQAPKPARAADVPATPIPCGIAVNCLNPLLFGPVSTHPSIWAFYWGTRFDGRKDFVSSINHGLENMVGDQFADPNSRDFWGPLGQYGVERGRFLGYDIVDENPDDSVGSWNFFDVVSFAFTHRYGSDAPNYWWRFSDQDPIFAIFVDQAEVDSSGWAGYHFFTPTEGLLFAFLAHPNMPWFIVKVPSLASLPTDRGSDGYRSAVDTTTERASHELVEAATDPYPFLSWADPLKQPIWEQGELADICAQGNHAPWGTATRVLERGTALAPYWDENAGACAPDARPTVQIAYPSDNQTYGWKSQVSFIAHADDLYDGSVPDSRIKWVDDRDGPLGTGSFLTTSKLTPGVHHISVTATDSTGGTASAGPLTVNVVVNPPQVRISAPADGSSFPSDQAINFRGSAFDPQDGDLAASATWSVDGLPVGTGATLFPYRIATQGAHIVTLSATNSGGLKASDGIKVNVGPATGKPSVAITAPENNASIGFADPNTSEATTFTATATAPGGATVPNSGYRWTDVPDTRPQVELGTGSSITAKLLGFACFDQGHTVTVTVTDSYGRAASDSIRVSVVQVC